MQVKLRGARVAVSGMEGLEIREVKLLELADRINAVTPLPTTFDLALSPRVRPGFFTIMVTRTQLLPLALKSTSVTRWLRR
jgi:hypothetical protein